MTEKVWKGDYCGDGQKVVWLVGGRKHLDDNSMCIHPTFDGHESQSYTSFEAYRVAYVKHVHYQALRQCMSQMVNMAETVKGATINDDLDLIRDLAEEYQQSALVWAQVALAARP